MAAVLSAADRRGPALPKARSAHGTHRAATFHPSIPPENARECPRTTNLDVRKTLLGLAAAALCASAWAVTDGALDGDGHPYVGLMVAQDADGNPLWRCSGTLLSPTLFLTAGHCTESARRARRDLVRRGRRVRHPGQRLSDDGDVGGTPTRTRDYDPNAFYLYDLGVVVLDEPDGRWTQYGALPSSNQLDSAADEAAASRTSRSPPWATACRRASRTRPRGRSSAERVRMVAYPHLLQINSRAHGGDFSILLSNNANTGGTCFGDSGGPNFIGDSNVVGGVTSFGHERQLRRHRRRLPRRSRGRPGLALRSFGAHRRPEGTTSIHAV